MYTFKQAFDKITEAYIKGDIQPYHVDFCFCGTLASRRGISWDTSIYSFAQLSAMEFALLEEIRAQTMGGPDMYFRTGNGISRESVFNHPRYEQALFDGMVKALDVLRKIHISRGEDVEAFEFKKRELSFS